MSVGDFVDRFLKKRGEGGRNHVGILFNCDDEEIDGESQCCDVLHDMEVVVIKLLYEKEEHTQESICSRKGSGTGGSGNGVVNVVMETLKNPGFLRIQNAGDIVATFGEVINEGVMEIGQQIESHQRLFADLQITKEDRKMFEQQQLCLAEEGIFLSPSFFHELIPAISATCGIYSMKHKCVVSSAFLIHNEWVVTNLHNVDFDYKKVVGKEEWKKQEHWEKIDNVEHWKSDLKENQYVCWFNYDSKTSAPLVVEFESDMIAFPELDVVLLKIKRDNALPKPIKVALNQNFVKKKSRCFIIGHSVDDRNKNAKRISMQRDNFVQRIEEEFVRYFTDTLPGNSGSPVLCWNERSETLSVYAVHHTGVTEQMNDGKHFGYNEGTKMVAVFEKLKQINPLLFNEIIK